MVEHHARGRRAPCRSAPNSRPQLGDRRVEVELAAARQHVGAERRRALGAGEDDADRVLLPRRAGLRDRRCRPTGRRPSRRRPSAQTEAPTSPRSPKLRSKASATRSKPRLAGAVDLHGRHPHAALGIGSLNASSRKRAAWLTGRSGRCRGRRPAAMCMRDLHAVLRAAPRRRARSACAAASRRCRRAAAAPAAAT